MQFNQRFIDIIFGVNLGILFCTSKYFVNNNYAKIMAILILCFILFNAKEIMINSLIVFLSLFILIHIIFEK